MNKNNPIEGLLICHKFYDEKHRRISAFADLQEGDTLKIYLVTCSKKDTFSRKTARKRLANYLKYSHTQEYKVDPKVIHPVIYSIPTTTETFKKDFLNFMYEKFFVKEDMTIYIENTNRVIVADLYGNITTKETHVVNSKIKTLSDSELKKYLEALTEDKKQEEKFQSYLEITSKMNDIDNTNVN